MTPDRATIKSLAVGNTLVLAACSTMSDQERKAFLCEQWDQGTKNLDQLMATYSFATGKRIQGRLGGGRSGFGFIDGDIKQLAQGVDTACNVQTKGSE